MLADETCRKILITLLTNDTFVTAGVIANQAGISTKTLRKYINEINTSIRNQGAEIQSKVSVGYRIVSLDDDKFERFKSSLVDSENSLIFYANSKRKRINYILRYLLSSDHPVNIHELAVRLYYSESSILKDMSEVEQILKKRGISMISHGNHGITVSGNEWKLRNFLIYEIKIFQNNNLIHVSEEVEFESIFQFDSKLYRRIHFLLMETLRKYRIQVAYINIQTIECWIMISKTRFKYADRLVFDGASVDWLYHGPLLEIAKEIYRQIFKDELCYTENDFVGLAILLERYDENHVLDDTLMRLIQLDAADLFAFFNRDFPGMFNYAENSEELNRLAVKLQLVINQVYFTQLYEFEDEYSDYLTQVELNGLFVLDLCLCLKKYLNVRYGIDLHDFSGCYLLFMNYCVQNGRKFRFQCRALCVLSMPKYQAQALMESLNMDELNIQLDKKLCQYTDIGLCDQRQYDFVLTDISQREILDQFIIPVIHVSYEFFHFNPIYKLGGISLKQLMIQKLFKKEYFIKSEKRYRSLSQMEEPIRTIIKNMGLNEHYYQALMDYPDINYLCKKNGLLLLKNFCSEKQNDSHIGFIYLKKPFRVGRKNVQMVGILHFGEENSLANMSFINLILSEMIHNINFHVLDYEQLDYAVMLEKMTK